MLSVNIIDTAIITVKNIDYSCIIHNTNKSVLINLSQILFLKIVGIYKKYCLEFESIETSFLNFLCSIYKMVDIMDVYKY